MNEEEVRIVLALPINKKTSLYKDQNGRIYIKLNSIDHITNSSGAIKNQDNQPSTIDV